MGIADKAKAQASQVARRKDQETARSGKAKLDKAQANQRANANAAAARRVGIYRAHRPRNRRQPGQDRQADQRDISAYEQENGLNLTGR